MSEIPGTGRPLRADAEANRQRILAAAAVLSERGLAVPMEEIAAAAGVGVSVPTFFAQPHGADAPGAGIHGRLDRDRCRGGGRGRGRTKPPGKRRARQRQRSARQAGFEVTAMRGLFLVEDPELMFEIYAATLEAVRERGIQLGIGAERIDGLVQDLRGAKGGGYEWVTSSFYLDLALRKPASG